MTKRALVVGCNYPGSPHQLAGCANDASSICSLLREVFEYKPQNMLMMVDSDPQALSPTGANIKAELTRLVGLTLPGDTLFFHFSGHGTQIPTDDPQETDGMDEAIVPTDMNVILDDDLRVIICKLPVGAHFTMLADCCHSGTMLDHKVRDLPVGSSKTPNGDRPYIGPSLNKSLPYEMLMTELGRTTGQQVFQGNMRYSLTQAFGPDASLKAQAYLGMLGEAFREEVAANGGRMPSFSLATIADVASRLWLKARAWKGIKQAHQPQGLYKKPGLRPPGGPTLYPSMPPHWARYPAFANSSNPSAAAFLNPASSSAAARYGQSLSSPVGYGQSSLPQQLAGCSAVMPSSSGMRLTPTAGPYPQIPIHPSSPFQQSGVSGLLNPNAAPYYPPVPGAGRPSTPVNNPSTPSSQQQQHLQQCMGQENLANPAFSMQPLQHLGKGYPNAVSGRMGHQVRVSASGYPGYSEDFEPGFQQTQHNQQGEENLYPIGELGSQHQHHFRVGFPHHHSKRLVVPMDWHMDVLAGKSPSTFSPLGDQAMSSSFPPVSDATPDYTTMDDQSMRPSSPPIQEPNFATLDSAMEHDLIPSSGPKRFTQHAFRVSTQKFAHGSFNPPEQLIAAVNPSQDGGAVVYPSQGYGTTLADPGQSSVINPSQIIYTLQQQGSGGPAGDGSTDPTSAIQPVLVNGMLAHPTQGSEAAQMLSHSSGLVADPHLGADYGFIGNGASGVNWVSGGIGAPGGLTQQAAPLMGTNGRPRISGRPGSKPHPSNQLHKDAAVLISGCMDAETSADSTAPSDPTRACGAMTNALVAVVREHYYNYPSTPLTNRDLVVKVREFLSNAGFAQHPCLGCSKQNTNLAFAV
ncbi:hypothetical protein WJX77_005579 [Trebouxia sp. C0004]